MELLHPLSSWEVRSLTHLVYCLIPVLLNSRVPAPTMNRESRPRQCQHALLPASKHGGSQENSSFLIRTILSTTLAVLTTVVLRHIMIGGYGLANKIKDEAFDAALYMKHWCTRTLCTLQYRHMYGTGWIECARSWQVPAANFFRVK